jgi:hypothetical protein
MRESAAYTPLDSGKKGQASVTSTKRMIDAEFQTPYYKIVGQSGPKERRHEAPFSSSD